MEFQNESLLRYKIIKKDEIHCDEIEADHSQKIGRNIDGRKDTFGVTAELYVAVLEGKEYEEY